MTIKPVVAPTQKQRSDAEKKDQVVVVEQPSSLGQQNVVRSAASHRNVVIDGHGQSPQRRGEVVYDELVRHRRSPHKSSRAKRREHHDHHHKRSGAGDTRSEREKVAGSGMGSGSNTGAHGGGVATAAGSAGGNSPANIGSGAVGGGSVGGGKSPEHLSGLPVALGCQSPKSKSQAQVTQAAANLLKAVEETYSGYNSGDEHLQPKEGAITVDEWQRRDEQFAKSMADRGYQLKPVEEDGACLFRSISLQIYGDEEMHDVIRQHTMDYIYKNREYFCHFVTEDINSYIKRKRRKDSHGNHIEIQAMSEIYSRPVEVYCYKPTPINIFNSEQLNNGYAPLRLSYQRGSHYNAIIDPYNATVGVGLGLAGYKPDLQTKDAAQLSEQLAIEQTMFEDKLKTTDWEATNEAIEEQIARESYLQWCRENLQKSRAVSTSTAASTSATVTSAEAASDAEASPSKYSQRSSTATTAATEANAATTQASGSGFTALAASGGSSGAASALTTLALSPKTLNNLKKDAFDSDDTDMSSTSSMGNAGNASPSAVARAAASKKTKKSRGIAVRGSKKRRREQHQPGGANKDFDSGSARKSPKHEAALASGVVQNVTATRERTPEAEQQPSTSKQSHTPEKHENSCSSSTSTSSSSNTTNTNTKQPCSSFYQELLEASYATSGLGQLNESEMLQRAIQMSTHDYIEDQKRKYLYGP